MEREAESVADIIRTQLRRHRIAAGLNQEDFGKLVHYSTSMVSALELGERPLNQEFLTRADEVLDTADLLVSLMEIARRAGQPLWFRPWLDAERTAEQLRCFQPTLIPGLLQTADYARAIFRGNVGLAEDAIEQMVDDRLARQRILTGEQPPQLVAVLDEQALRRFGGGADKLMVDQLLHLLACAERPNISIHVIPTEAALHIGLSGPFALAKGFEGGWLGHLEHQLGGTVVDDEKKLAVLQAQWESVRSDALPRRQSMDLIKEILQPWI